MEQLTELGNCSFTYCNWETQVPVINKKLNDAANNNVFWYNIHKTDGTHIEHSKIN